MRMNTEEIKRALEHKWEWRAGGRYNYSCVDQYDSNDSGHGTYGNIDISTTFRSMKAAENVSGAMNQAYNAGVKRGKAQLINALLKYSVIMERPDLEQVIHQFLRYFETLDEIE